MINRFKRIKAEFGGWVFFRVLLLFLGLLGLFLLNIFILRSFLIFIIIAVGLLAGVLLKNKIADGAEFYPKIITVGLFIYGLVAFLGDRFGFDKQTKLAIIAATTVIIFDLQFWSLSDPSIINQENIEDRRKT